MEVLRIVFGVPWRVKKSYVLDYEVIDPK